MTNIGKFIPMVSLYIFGDNIDPTDISSRLGANPTDYQVKGERFFTKSGHEITRKTGMWMVSTTTKSEFLSDHIKQLRTIIAAGGDFIRSLNGVEDAHIDVYLNASRDGEAGGTLEIILECSDLDVLNSFELPVHFTADLTAA